MPGGREMIRAIKVGGSRKFIFAWHHKHRDMCTQKAVKSPNVPKSGGSAQLVTFRFVFFFFLRIFPLVRSCAELTLAQAVSDVVNGMVSMHSTWSKSLLGLKYSCSYKGRL